MREIWKAVNCPTLLLEAIPCLAMVDLTSSPQETTMLSISVSSETTRVSPTKLLDELGFIRYHSSDLRRKVVSATSYPCEYTHTVLGPWALSRNTTGDRCNLSQN